MGRMMGTMTALLVLSGCAGPMTQPGFKAAVGSRSVGNLPSVVSAPGTATPCPSENWAAYVKRLHDQPDLFVGPEIQDHLRAMFTFAAGSANGSLSLRTFPLIVDPNPDVCTGESSRRQRLFQLTDLDKDGRVTVNEFTHPDFLQFIIKGRMISAQPEFTRMDKDDSRFLSLSEWVFPGSYLPRPDTTSFKRADTDGDGRVSLYEFACYQASSGPIGASAACLSGCNDPATPAQRTRRP